MSDIVPELLWLKYRGVRAPWEIERDAKRFGYKCRKYARWEAVHVAPDSADLLRKLADDLLDGDGMSLDDFGHLSRIWERVQRWTKDKEGLSLEPDKYQEFETLERLLTQGSQDLAVVDGVLIEALGDCEQLSETRRWSAFKCICLGRFLNDGERCRSLIGKGHAEPRSCKHLVAFEEWVAGQVPLVYGAIGFSVSADSPSEVIDLLLGEMGLPIEVRSEHRTRGAGRKVGPPDVVVEETKRNDLRLVEATMQAGTMVMKINAAHPAIRDESPFHLLLQDEQLWHCFGLACRDNLGQLEDIQSYFDSVGVHLASSSRTQARARAGRED